MPHIFIVKGLTLISFNQPSNNNEGLLYKVRIIKNYLKNSRLKNKVVHCTAPGVMN